MKIAMLHLHGSVGQKTSDDLFPLELDQFRIHLLKNYSIGAVRNVLELLHKIIKFGVVK